MAEIKTSQMKKVFLFLVIGLWFLETSAQSYDGLSKLESVTQQVYFSADAKDRATSILGDVANAENILRNSLT